jgi:hypothetical protein
MVKGPAADATDALQPWGWLCNPMMMKMKMMMIFCPFPSNGATMEWNWQGKTEELGEKPVAVPLCPPQIPHGLTRDRTRASAVGGRRLTAWAMARPWLCVTGCQMPLRINILWQAVSSSLPKFVSSWKAVNSEWKKYKRNEKRNASEIIYMCWVHFARDLLQKRDNPKFTRSDEV